MAIFSESQYGKFVSLQNNSGSADAAAPSGGIYLFASGAVGSARLYMQNEGGTITDLAKSLDIDAFTALGGTGLAQGDNFVFSDGGTEKKVTFSNLEDAIFGNVSGDATIAAGGALTIAATSVENGMLAGSIADSKLNTITTANKVSLSALDIDGATALGGASVAQADLLVIDDGAGGTNKSVTFSNFEDSIFANISGDATVAAGGALTIANDAVEQAMIADDAVGADQLAANAVVNASIASNAAIDMDKLDGGSLASSLSDLAQGDLLYAGDIDDSNNIKSITFSNLEDAIFGNVSGDATIAAGGALTIAANAVEGSMLNSNTAGDGLTYASNTLAVQVSGAVAITSDKVGISGSFAGAGLAYSGAVGAIGGLSLDIDNLDALGSAGLHQTQDHFAFSDNGTEKKITFSNLQDAVFADVSGDATIAAGGALTIANDAVESGMLNDNVISGQTELASDGLAAADEMMISDGGTLKKIGVDNLMKDGPGLLTAAAVAVADDHFMFLDGGATGDAKIESVADLMTAVAGDGLAASSGVLAVGVDDSSIELDSDALRVKASGVTNAMLAGSIANAKLANSSVTVGGSAVSLGGTVTGAMIGAALNSDLGGNVQFGNQSNDTVAFGGPIKIGGNAIANSEGESTITMDADQNVGVAAALTVGGGYGSTGVSVTSAGAINADGALTIGADGAGVNFTAYGGAANELMRYDAGNHVLQFVNGSGATMLNLGGDATTEYALDVANGSDNINKVRAAAFVTYSDESLKSDVATMNTALDTVMSLNGVEFTWNDSGERDFGFIAQDVQNVLPQAVHVAADGVQGVDYSRLTSVLVEAVKAQQVQIEELKTLLKK